MNYYLDTEFIEGFKKPIKWLPTIGNFNKPYHSIQLISIGIVADDGREYYAISNEYNYDDANDWVKENVILKIYREQIAGFKQQYMDIKTFHKHIPNGKSNKQIAEEVKKFCLAHVEINTYPDIERWGKDCPPVFYGYYADYDWVVFCSLFGTMMDLPKGFPMYCKDLRQVQDEVSLRLEGFEKGTPDNVKVQGMKYHVGYPKQTNEHNALADAKWNKALHEFLKTV